MALSFSSSGPTVGIELEWQLVDASTFQLSDAVTRLLPELDRNARIKPELLQCAIEVTEGPSDSVADLRVPLLNRLSELLQRCRAAGVRLCGAATSALPSGLREVTPTERYLRVSRTGMFLTRRLQATTALHVHVGMPSVQACVSLIERLRGTLPALLALSSSSPFWDGYDTGFSSFRHRLLAMTPNYGPPPRMKTVDDLEQLMSAVSTAGIGTSYRDVHWDLRPRPDFGTLELRVCDAQPTLSSSLALAAVAHSLFVAALRERVLDDVLIPPLSPWIERENAFRASRHGLAAQLITSESGATHSVRELLTGLLSALAPVAVELGEGAELEGAIDLLLEGSWADRARAHYERSGSLAATTRALCDVLDDELEDERRVDPNAWGRELH